MKIDISLIDINNHFELQEFFIEPIDEVLPKVPAYVVESVIKHYLLPLNSARNEFGKPIVISRRSCFRSVQHEESRGRNGLSLHTFGTHSKDPSDIDRKGACDITTSYRNTDRFAELGILLARLPFNRICVYPNNGFYHVDYNAENKFFYVAESPTDSWRQLRFEQFLEHAEEAFDD